MKHDLLTSKQEKMKAFLEEKGPYPFLNRSYRFLAFKMENSNDERQMIGFLEELLLDSFYLNIEEQLVVFYFEEYDIRALIASISDDFSMQFSCFQSGKMDPKQPSYFFVLFHAITAYRSNRVFLFADNADLILGLVRSDVTKLRQLSPIILNRVNNDSQLEQLIKAMFEHDLNVSKAAQSVYMHRNTVINKLEFITSETGLNIQHFKHASCMYWLLSVKR
jgi:DNA-binding PucR family transcriptional regulator